MSHYVEKCDFCGGGLDRKHELLWDVNAFGVWCGVCDDGFDFVSRSVCIADIVARRDLIRERFPALRESIARLDKILTIRSETGIRTD